MVLFWNRTNLDSWYCERDYKLRCEVNCIMCLAVPGLVETVDGRTAIVDFGGVKREAVIDLMEEGTVRPGTYVLVHTGFVIQVLDKKEAEETLELWREVLSNVENPRGEL